MTTTNILLRRRGAIGDVILTTGVVRELYKRYDGNALIDIATDCGEVFTNNEYVHCVHHTTQVPDVDYDVIINLDDAYEVNPNLPIIDAYFHRALGSIDFDKSSELYINDTARVDSLVSKINGDFVCIHIRNYGGWSFKNIPIGTWLSVIDTVLSANKDIKIVCVGSATDFCPANHPRIIDARGLELAELSYLFDYSKCFVGIDSAPFHVAGSSSTHLVALLSHAPPTQVLPFRNNQQGYNCSVIQASVPCTGCYTRQKTPVRSILCDNPESYKCTRSWDTEKIAMAILGQFG